MLIQKLRGFVVSINENLNTLSRRLEVLKKQGPGRNEALEQVTNAIYELNTQIRAEEHSIEEWFKIYDTISEYSKIDFTPESYYGKFLRIFVGAIYGHPKTLIQSMISYTEQGMAESIANYRQDEEGRVKNEWRTYFLSGLVDASNVREVILSQRLDSPRVTLSLQEEAQLIHRVIDQLPDKTAAIEKFQGQLEAGLFSLRRSLAALEAEGMKEKGALLLDPSAASVAPETINKLRIGRLHRLMHLEEVYDTVMRDPAAQVATKFFPSTYGWFIGAFQSLPLFSLLEIEMQAIANQHGIKVIGDRRLDSSLMPMEIGDQYRLDALLNIGSLVESHGLEVLGPFVQDIVDFSFSGEIRIPRLRHHMEEWGTDRADCTQWVIDSRIERSQEWREIIKDELADPEALGAVFMNDLPLKALSLADSLKCQPVMNLTYNEGGNTLIGQRGNQPYVIIGLDSYAVSKKLMEKDIGRTLSEEEVRLAFAIDYGVLKENVFFVEQPGDFHLDMSMAIVGENTILLNDSVQAYEMFVEEQQKWKEEYLIANPEYSKAIEGKIEQTRRESVVRKRMEDMTASQLGRLGFKVIRVPGKFNYINRVPAMNLFNMVTAQAPSRENIVVMLGCVSQKYQEMFSEIITTHCDRKIDRFHFLDLQSSQESLTRFGGIACRTKTIPN